MWRAVAVIVVAFLVAATCVAVLDGAGAVTGDECPAGLLLDPGSSGGGNCVCPDTGEGIGYIGTDGVYAPFDNWGTPDSDGDCATSPFTTPAPDTDDTERVAGGYGPQPSSPGVPVYPTPEPAPVHSDGPVSGTPTFTG